MRALAAVRAEVEGEPRHRPPYVLLTIAAGETSARARLAWAEEARAVLAGLAERAPAPDVGSSEDRRGAGQSSAACAAAWTAE